MTASRSGFGIPSSSTVSARAIRENFDSRSRALRSTAAITDFHNSNNIEFEGCHALPLYSKAQCDSQARLIWSREQGMLSSISCLFGLCRVLPSADLDFSSSAAAYTGRTSSIMAEADGLESTSSSVFVHCAIAARPVTEVRLSSLIWTMQGRKMKMELEDCTCRT